MSDNDVLAVLPPADQERIGLLIDVAISELWSMSPDCMPDDDCELDEAAIEKFKQEHPGCCPVCCPQCAVLAELYLTGQLENWLKKAPSDPAKSYTWDGSRDQVDRAWLLRAWENTRIVQCHDGVVEAVAEVDVILAHLREELAARI